jgi:hypothetical protein
VRFTWWGGFVGGPLLSHAECPSCRRRYNSKTGQPNTLGIVMYSLVVGSIGAVVVYLVFHHH